ncbi:MULTISPECIES: nucleoside hydrolase [Burkholderiaceae]|uniref:Inosine-uridine preferring nucleoside hydrolase n=1 Tax=Caballeronia sordidicola TaxID=196367 RepID=A0A242MB83_CABSO|nr:MULTISPECIES: nucleoside hydrolase [Burkholderiaceae]AMH43160.1 nucleoside hydrolase [Burkholderia sp. PAMC 26561]OTP68399.1 Inosine-uridine preferring nucleoside hydrolase [Caballeronia sordidicola]
MSQTSSFPRRTFLKASAALTASALFNPLARAANGRRTVIIDCDPGQDDAIAILFALGAHDRLDVRALTAVAGNVPLNLTERNARIIRDWAGATKTLPVHAGCPHPIMRELITAANVHGKTGLEGVELHEPLAPLAAQHAVAYLIDTLKAAPPKSVTICALGPLTNIATALTEAPEIRDALREIVLMGGAFFERGNITPAAEFNIYVDPQAASIVFSSGVPIVVLPRDVAVKAPITPARIAPIRAIGNRCGALVADIMAAEVKYQKGRRGVEEAPMYDPTAAGYLVDPSLFKGKLVNVVVETTGQFTLGETVVDWSGHSGRAPNATWITDVDADAFYAALRASIATLP